MTRLAFRLFAQPSFLEGLARLIDVGGTLNEYEHMVSPEEANFLAIEADWEAVGEDIVAAIEKFRRRHREAVGE
jgi:hypothetical protein